jgi:hypothetical protein
MNDVVDRLEMLLRGEILLSEPEKRALYREAAAEIEKLRAEVGDKYEDWSEEDRKMFAVLREKGTEPLS